MTRCKGAASVWLYGSICIREPIYQWTLCKVWLQECLLLLAAGSCWLTQRANTCSRLLSPYMTELECCQFSTRFSLTYYSKYGLSAGDNHMEFYLRMRLNMISCRNSCTSGKRSSRHTFPSRSYVSWYCVLPWRWIQIAFSHERQILELLETPRNIQWEINRSFKWRPCKNV